MFTIGITGGSGSGKTVLADKLVNHFGPDRAVIIAQDSYYRDHSHLPPAKRQEGNFDEPKAVELSLLVEHIDQLRAGRPIQEPRYDYATHTRIGAKTVEPHDIVIVDGLFVLTDDELRSRMDLKVFVDAPESERVRRRIRRDMQERGRTEEEVIERLNGTVLPMHAIYVEPCKGLADLVVDGCGDADAEAARVIVKIEERMGR